MLRYGTIVPKEVLYVDTVTDKESGKPTKIPGEGPKEWLDRGLGFWNGKTFSRTVRSRKREYTIEVFPCDADGVHYFCTCLPLPAFTAPEGAPAVISMKEMMFLTKEDKWANAAMMHMLDGFASHGLRADWMIVHQPE